MQHRAAVPGEARREKFLVASAWGSKGREKKKREKKARAFVAYRVVFCVVVFIPILMYVCIYNKRVRIGIEGSSGGRYGVPAAAGRV